MASIIQQIAEDLNVSSASVSRALNNRAGVGVTLREKILARARELKYTPSFIARGLATQKSYSIGFFVHEKPGLAARTDPFYGEILQGVEQVIGQSDYHVTIGTLTDDILTTPQDFRFVRERRIDGMILAGPDIPATFIRAMIESNLPIVLVDNKLNSSVTCINSDDEGGGYLAASHLIELGHREIGILTGPTSWASNARRLRGYRRALEEHCLQSCVVGATRTDIESGKQAFRELIAQSPAITAICAVNDSMAIGVIHAAQDKGLRIPDDLSVVGFDDISWASLNNPPLTTIRIAKTQIGKEAARHLQILISEPEEHRAEILVSVSLIQRASTRHIERSC
jgi:LacI family transcriptional regulator